MPRYVSVGRKDPARSADRSAPPNDFGFLLQEHDADPEREPPGECSGPSAPTLPAANPG
jgi:hypothetical protein